VFDWYKKTVVRLILNRFILNQYVVKYQEQTMQTTKMLAEQITTRTADEETKAFTAALAKMLSEYEASTGNTVAVNLNITFTDEEKSPIVPFSYARDLKLIDENGNDTPRPTFVNTLDCSHGLAAFMPTNIAEVISGISDQIRDYDKSEAGPFVVMNGKCLYQNEAPGVIERAGGPGALVEELAQLDRHLKSYHDTKNAEGGADFDIDLGTNLGHTH
jgi:hypothetical protein